MNTTSRVRIVAVDNGKAWDYATQRWADFPAQNVTLNITIVRGDDRVEQAESLCAKAQAAGNNATSCMCADTEDAIAEKIEFLRGEVAHDHRTPGGVEANVTIVRA